VVKAREAWVDNKNMQLYNWALGGALFANCVGFFGISYWDQTQVVWYAFLAVIVASYYSVPVAAEAAVAVPVLEPQVRAAKPLRPAYAAENAKPVTSYGRMVTGRLTPKSTTK
jgi:branched-subunit amino acid ABC-type transport system permease component